MKIKLEKGKKVSICTCGQSKDLPYCDSAHREYNELHNTEYRSVKLIPEEDVEIEVTSKKF